MYGNTLLYLIIFSPLYAEDLQPTFGYIWRIRNSYIRNYYYS